jgi:uncharacterized protein YkwD
MPPIALLPALSLVFTMLPLTAWRDPLASSPDIKAAQSVDSANHDAELALCVNAINGYRQGAGRSPLVRDATLEKYAADAAGHDAKAKQPHHFGRSTNFGNGLALAENEIPRWPLDSYDSVSEIIETGLAEMWKEGPGGGHYQNIVGEYTRVGCGIYVAGNEVTVVQAFR